MLLHWYWSLKLWHSLCQSVFIQKHKSVPHRDSSVSYLALPGELALSYTCISRPFLATNLTLNVCSDFFFFFSLKKGEILKSHYSTPGNNLSWDRTERGGWGRMYSPLRPGKCDCGPRWEQFIHLPKGRLYSQKSTDSAWPLLARLLPL